MKEVPGQGGPAEEAKTDEKMDKGLDVTWSRSSPPCLAAESRARGRDEPWAMRKKVTVRETLKTM